MTDEEMIENLQCVVNDISEQCNKLNAENAAPARESHKSRKRGCRTYQNGVLLRV